MVVAKISEAKASELKELEYKGGVKYNPIQDINDNWVISMTELEHSSELIGEVDLIEYVGKPAEERIEESETTLE